MNYFLILYLEKTDFRCNPLLASGYRLTKYIPTRFFFFYITNLYHQTRVVAYQSSFISTNSIRKKFTQLLASDVIISSLAAVTDRKP